MPNDPSCHPMAAEPEGAETELATACDQPMRIYLPNGGVRLMRLTEYQEFLLSYSIESPSPDETES